MKEIKMIKYKHSTQYKKNKKWKVKKMIKLQIF